MELTDGELELLIKTLKEYEEHLLQGYKEGIDKETDTMADTLFTLHKSVDDFNRHRDFNRINSQVLLGVSFILDTYEVVGNPLAISLQNKILELMTSRMINFN